MAIRAIGILKDFFKRGLYPTESNFEDLIDSCYGSSDVFESKIYEPETEPSIVIGTPNTLTFDLNDARQAIYEPRLSVGTHSINVDHTVIFSNSSNGLLFSIFYRLTGTIIITLPSDVKCSVPSTIGTWNNVAKTLTLTAGTDDDILFVFQKNKTGGFWDLSVNEISL